MLRRSSIKWRKREVTPRDDRTSTRCLLMYFTGAGCLLCSVEEGTREPMGEPSCVSRNSATAKGTYNHRHASHHDRATSARTGARTGITTCGSNVLHGRGSWLVYGCLALFLGCSVGRLGVGDSVSLGCPAAFLTGFLVRHGRRYVCVDTHCCRIRCQSPTVDSCARRERSVRVVPLVTDHQPAAYLDDA